MKLTEVKKGLSVADLGIEYKVGDFYCNSNNLTSLVGAPEKVNGHFVCSFNDLTSLKGAPPEVGGAFHCQHNKLTSLEGAPQKVGTSFSCTANNLTSLEGAPSEVGVNFLCDNNNLTSLKSIHRIIKQINGYFACEDNPIKDGWEYILLIKGVKSLSTNNSTFDKIANEYLKTNPSGTIKAALDVKELMAKASK